MGLESVASFFLDWSSKSVYNIPNLHDCTKISMLTASIFLSNMAKNSTCESVPDLNGREYFNEIWSKTQRNVCMPCETYVHVAGTHTCKGDLVLWCKRCGPVWRVGRVVDGEGKEQGEDEDDSLWH